MIMLPGQDSGAFLHMTGLACISIIKEMMI